MAVNPFKITVYNAQFQRQGFIGNPSSVSVTPRHNQKGTASIALDADHRMAPAMSAEGARVVFHHKPSGAWEFLMSGWVESYRGEGPKLNAKTVFQIVDDGVVLEDTEGWPVPGSPISNQSAAEYATYTGPAETVVKNAARANFQRLGLPVTVATDQGRGATVPGGVAFRFHPLADKLRPAADVAGIGITVRQEGAGLVLDCYTPREYVHKLSEEAGTVIEWSFESRSPTTTRAIVGGKGEGTARAFNSYTDTALEGRFGRVRETFKDATDVDTAADLQARAQQTVTEGAPTYGFSVKLSESGMFRYGENGIRVGDRVTLDIGGAERTDILRECTLAFNRESGPTQTPVIGDIDQGQELALVRFLNGLARGLRDSKR